MKKIEKEKLIRDLYSEFKNEHSTKDCDCEKCFNNRRGILRRLNNES